MLRNINGWLSKWIKYKFNVKSRLYLGAGVRCMEDHVTHTVPNGEVKQTERRVGTNDLMKGKNQMQINLVFFIKDNAIKMESVIVPRNDGYN